MAGGSLNDSRDLNIFAILGTSKMKSIRTFRDTLDVAPACLPNKSEVRLLEWAASSCRARTWI